MSKPFLKWAGGKAKLVPFIESNLPKSKRKRLVEPFVGGAALTLGIEFESYLINDVNVDLIDLYFNLQNQKKEFINYCSSFFVTEYNQEKIFYEMRDRFNNLAHGEVERAALFVYLNRHAFNGLCRYDNQGRFNVPFGRYKSPYFPLIEMEAFVKKSDRILITSTDFRQVFEKFSKHDLVYCDPPYVPLSKTAYFTAYSKNGFNLDDQIELAELASKNSKKTKGVLISNHDTDYTREIYRGAEIKTIEVQRNIAAKGTSRKKASELLAIYKK